MKVVKPNVFIINIHRENWDECLKDHRFGIRVDARHPKFDEGDIFIVRKTGKDYGVMGIWIFKREEYVTSQDKVPWEDYEYRWQQWFDPLVDFKTPVSEEFIGVSKFSEKLKMPAMRIVGSVVHLSDSEAIKYIELILKEKAEELQDKVNLEGKEVNKVEILRSLLDHYQKEEEKPPTPSKKQKRGMISGEPINFRGMVYAPLNEAGVVLLFSKIMDDLGIIYESSPLKDFDMVGRIQTDRGFELKHFEFEYKSSNFKIHEHDPATVDYLVCWEHDWTNCPDDLEVWELRERIKDMPAQFNKSEVND